MKKYSIDNFYVGELYFSCLMNNMLLSDYNKNLIKIKSKCHYLLLSGAVDFQKQANIQCIDSLIRKYYQGVFTLFFQTKDDTYVCLHNGIEYSFNEKNTEYCENLRPFKDFFPKISYSCPIALSFYESLTLFHQLFCQKHHFHYKKIFFDIRNFYIGNLNFCHGFHRDYSNSLDYYYMNLASQYSTFNSSSKFIRSFKINDKEIEKDRVYDYSIFKCLFLKINNNELYNINNFQIYNVGILENKNYNHFINGECFYDEIIPFSSEFENNNIYYDRNCITISKALNLQKKILKK